MVAYEHARIAKLRTRPCRESLEWFWGVIGMGQARTDSCHMRRVVVRSPINTG